MINLATNLMAFYKAHENKSDFTVGDWLNSLQDSDLFKLQHILNKHLEPVDKVEQLGLLEGLITLIWQYEYNTIDTIDEDAIIDELININTCVNLESLKRKGYLFVSGKISINPKKTVNITASHKAIELIEDEGELSDEVSS